MAKRDKTNIHEAEPSKRHYVRVVAFMVFGMSIGALLMYHVYPRIAYQPIVYERTEREGTTDTVATTSYERALPTVLRIPSIKLETTFEAPLALSADQSIEVPDSYDAVGWYKLGASPGERGPAIVLGHVDSYQGPAVFYSLGQLKAGDQVFIERADGTEVAFEVMYLERYSQDDFPTEKVYGMTDGPELRLITCTGVFDKGVQRYSHNLVVYARLVEGGEGE